jgi:hypothetical protein
MNGLWGYPGRLFMEALIYSCRLSPRITIPSLRMDSNEKAMRKALRSIMSHILQTL